MTTIPTVLDGQVRILELESFRDDRGTLTHITLDEVGLTVARSFVVRAPRGAVRGGHAHRRVRQVLFRASGTIRVDLSRHGEHASVVLDEQRPALLIEAGVWAQQTYLDDGSTLIVFADGPFDPAEYTTDDDATAEDAS